MEGEAGEGEMEVAGGGTDEMGSDAGAQFGGHGVVVLGGEVAPEGALDDDAGELVVSVEGAAQRDFTGTSFAESIGVSGAVTELKGDCDLGYGTCDPLRKRGFDRSDPVGIGTEPLGQGVTNLVTLNDGGLGGT